MPKGAKNASKYFSQLIMWRLSHYIFLKNKQRDRITALNLKNPSNAID
jgi:hypothetical protein